MAKTGRLTKELMGFGVPTDAPLLIKPPAFYKDIESLAFTYETDEEAALEILPEGLELFSPASASIAFMKFGLSTWGGFKEALQGIKCLWNGHSATYLVHVMVNIDAAMAGGRELFGEGKKFAHINIDLQSESEIIMGTMERPLGNRICTGVMRPVKRKERAAGAALALSLRILPNPEPGKGPSLTQLIEINPNINNAPSDVWEGIGSVQLNSTSIIDPWHKLPVKKMLSATYSTCPFREEYGRIVKEY